jgi:uroporphyrinogen decarboxylase
VAGMTSRERVLAALSHRQPDRVPLDLGGTRNSSMVVEGYERLKALFDAVLDVTLQVTKHQLAAVGQEVDVVFCSDDLGAQNALQMSHEHYLRYIKPRHKKFFRMVHELTPAKLVFHSCGSVAPIIEDLIEIGVDCLNPVQPTAAGMDPAELKRKYRGRMAFWGGTENQRILPRGSVREVKRMVEELIEQTGEGGGYVFSSCHNLQPDVPLEDVLALFEHAREYVPSFAR